MDCRELVGKMQKRIKPAGQIHAMPSGLVGCFRYLELPISAPLF